MTEGTGDIAVDRQPLPVRGAVRLIFDRQFGSVFWGKLLSVAGVWSHTVVAAVAVYAATGSALWVGLVSVVQYTPQILLTPLSGKWADRGNIPRQMVVGRLLCITGSGSLAVFFFVRGALDGQSDVIVVLAATLVTGLGVVVGGPAQQSIVPLLIRPGELPTAMALNSLPMTLALVGGPVGGAFVTAHYGPALAFALAALTHVIFVILLLYAALPRGAERESGTDFRVRAALKYVWHDRPMLLLLIVVAAVGFGGEPSVTLAPIIADQLGGGTQLVGQLTGAFGVGALVGFLGYQLLSRLMGQPRVVQTGMGAMIVGTGFLPFAPEPVLAMSAFAVAGTGFMVASTAAATLIQMRVPPLLRGRLMALWMVGLIGSRPLASALGGYLADTVSLAAALLAVVGVLLTVFLFFRPRRVSAQ